MAWLVAIAILIMLSSAYAIHCSIEMYAKLATEHPSFETLVTYTGIGQRDVFIELLGPPDEFGCFYVPADQLKNLPREKFHAFIESPYLECSCILGASILVPIWNVAPLFARFLLSLIVSIQVVGYLCAFVSLYRSDLWDELFNDDTTET